MNCDTIKELFADYLSENPDPKTRLKIEEHMAACISCRQEIAGLSQIWSKLSSIPDEEPDPEISRRFYEMLDAYTDGINTIPVKVPLGEKLRGLIQLLRLKHPVFQVAIALFFLIAGFMIGRMYEKAKPAGNEIAVLQEEMKEMRQVLTISLMNRPSAIDRLRGVTMIRSVNAYDEELLAALLKTLNTDPNVNVRLAAVEAVSYYCDRAWIRTELVKSLSRETSPLVQISLIELLVNIREKDALEVFKSMTQDQNNIEPVKSRARLGIEKII